MNDLLLIAAENSVAALMLAVVVFGITRLLRNPPLAHLLWLLVLVKLVAPPVTHIEWSILQTPEPLPSIQPRLESKTPEHSRGDEREVAHVGPQPAVEQTLEASSPGSAEPAVTDVTETPSTEIVPEPRVASIGTRDDWVRAVPFIFYLWLGGTLAYAFVAMVRILRFHRALGEMLPASAELQRVVNDAARKLGVGKAPEVRCAEGIGSPLLWCVARPTIVLPTRMLRDLDDRQVSMIVAHELAHLRRRDHWVRVIELLVAIVYWWNPLVWLIRRQLHQAEELCCDAWVRWAFPEGRKRYAQTVLSVAESLSVSSVGALLMPASPFLRSCSLKERIQMILESHFEPCVSMRSTFAVALAAVLILPTFVSFNRVDAADQDAATHSEFPYAVKFEQGATKFLEGDKITIVEVRGTAETFKPGDIYLVKGTYTLASHDRASLAAYTTAKNAAEGTSKSYSAQTTTVKKGTGTFTLFLPMSCEGWPHVSFYPAEGGEGFGGNYFGTGESVLKRWWGSKEAQAPAKDGKAAKPPDGLNLLLLSQLQQTKKDLRKLRDETGELSVDDPSKFHAIALDADEPNTWRWRLYTPKGHRYFWNITCGEIPADGVPSPGPHVISGHSNEPFWEHDNEVLVTVKLRPVSDEEWTLSVESRIGGGSMPQMYGAQAKVAADKIRWMSDSCINGQVRGDRGTEVLDPHGPIILLQRRACERQPDGSYKPSEKPMPGFVVWLEEQPLGGNEAAPPAKDDKAAKQSQSSPAAWRAFGRVTDGDGRPLAGVEIRALCGGPTPRRAGIATSGDDGRYELDFNPVIGRSRDNDPAAESTLILARKAGYYEQNLNRQGKCLAATAPPDDKQLKYWHVEQDRVFLPEKPLEIDFVMRPAGKVAGRLVDEEGKAVAGYSVSLQGPDLPPASSVVSDARTDDQGEFVLEDVPASFRYQIVVRKSNPKPPWDDSWAGAAIRFGHSEQDDLKAWFGERELRAQRLVIRLEGPGVHGRTATRLAGNRGILNLTADNAADVSEQTGARLALKSAVLTLSNAAGVDVSRSLISEFVPAPAASGFPTRLSRGRADDAGQFTISFENPPGFDLVRGKHQIIFQIFVGASQKPIREKIFKQLDIEEGRYEVPVTVAPELIDDSRVSVTFVTIQPEHDAWVKAFFHDGKGTTYRGIWTSDGDILPAIPLAVAPQK